MALAAKYRAARISHQRRRRRISDGCGVAAA
jgi:hypothetical protein